MTPLQLLIKSEQYEVHKLKHGLIFVKILNQPFHDALCRIELQAISKIADYAQEQGKSRRKSAAYT
jgi:hypothetical protein